MYDVVPELSMRSELGRVVVNPPDRKKYQNHLQIQ